MKIKLKDIPREGYQLDEDLSAEDLGLLDESFKICSLLKVQGDVYRRDLNVLADVDVAGEYEFQCARCLEPIRQKRDDQFSIVMEIEPLDELVDVGEEIRQEILVMLSGRMLCREDCQGLCQSCGVNLNLEVCRCGKK